MWIPEIVFTAFNYFPFLPSNALCIWLNNRFPSIFANSLHLCSENGWYACSSDSETTDDEGGDQIETKDEGGDYEERPVNTRKQFDSGSSPLFQFISISDLYYSI